MRERPLLLLALAACGKPVAPPLSHSAGATPTLTVASDGRPMPENFPATDGKRVVFAHVVSLPAHGYLELVLRDRDDKELERRKIGEYDEAQDPDPGLGKRVADANRWIAGLGVVAMTQLEVDYDHSGETQVRHTRGTPVISWAPSTLTIAGAARPTPETWLAADHPMFAGAGPDEQCHNEAQLGAVASGGGLYAVTITYLGTDTCWEPGPSEHVVVP